MNSRDQLPLYDGLTPLRGNVTDADIESHFLPEDFREGNPSSPVYLGATGDFPAELALFYRLGVDGVFTDNPDVAVAVRTELQN